MNEIIINGQPKVLSRKITEISSESNDTQYPSAKAVWGLIESESPYTEITWSSLKELRDSEDLKPGNWYRITDYECTTIQEDTRAQFWRFDIIVVADDDHTLNENATAAYHEAIGCDNEWKADWYLVGKQTITDGSGNSKEAYVWETKWYDGNNIVIYKIGSPYKDKSLLQYDTPLDYYEHGQWTFNIMSPEDCVMWDFDNDCLYKSHFEESNLEAWELKYCIDNDTTRFGWADKNVYADWISSEEILEGEHLEYQGLYLTDYSSYPIPVYGTKEQAERFAGSSYEEDVLGFIDVGHNGFNPEFDNIIAIIDTNYITIEGCGATTEVSDINTYVGKGVIYYMKDEFNNECPYDFKNIQFKRYAVSVKEEYEVILGDSIFNLYPYFGNQLIDGYIDCFNVDTDDYNWLYTIHDAITDSDATINNLDLNLDGSYGVDMVNSNIIKHYTVTVTIDDISYRKLMLNNITMLNRVIDDELSGNSCENNKFENDCHDMSFGKKCRNNIFKNNCEINIFGNYIINSYFGSYCSANVFSNNCESNNFDYACRQNIFGNDCSFNNFKNGCSKNIFNSSCNDNVFNQYCSHNKFGYEFSNNIFGVGCEYNIFGDGFRYNIFGNGCTNNIFGSSITDIKNYYTHITYENGVSYIILNALQPTMYDSNECKNIRVQSGVCGTHISFKTLTVPTNNNNYLTVFGNNSNGELKSWTPADLIN